jgi:hypothetical protein
LRVGPYRLQRTEQTRICYLSPAVALPLMVSHGVGDARRAPCAPRAPMAHITCSAGPRILPALSAQLLSVAARHRGCAPCTSATLSTAANLLVEDTKTPRARTYRDQATSPLPGACQHDWFRFLLWQRQLGAFVPSASPRPLQRLPFPLLEPHRPPPLRAFSVSSSPLRMTWLPFTENL